MNSDVGRPRIGHWYTRWDNGEIFQVTALKTPSGTIEVQTFDGDLFEIADASWGLLPLGLTAPPEGWLESSESADLSDLDAAIAAELSQMRDGENRHGIDDCASASMPGDDLPPSNDAIEATTLRDNL
jgi:hypothetical protein